MGSPFIIGERYFDRRGNYIVVAIHGNSITVRYDDGTEHTGDLQAKARIFRNILDDQQADHPVRSPLYFRTVGFLAGHGEFQAEVPPQSRENFEEQYCSYTHIRPVLHRDGYYPIDVVDPYDKWGPELRIYFPDSLGEFELPPGVEVREGNAPGLLRINNNQFWWQLIRVGFRLLRDHRVERIRETVPFEFRREFEAGFAL